MKLVVTNRASDWLQQMGIVSGSLVAIWADKRAGQVQINYQVKQSDQPVATASQGGLNFYVEFADEWFFSGKQVTIDYCGCDRLTYTAIAELATTAGTAEQQAASSTSDASTAASRKYEEYWE